MTRRPLFWFGLCMLASLAMWWGIVSLGCAVARAEWKRVPVELIDPGIIKYTEPDSINVWVGPDSSNIVWHDSLSTLGIADTLRVERFVNLDSLLTEIKQGHDAEIRYLAAIGRAR